MISCLFVHTSALTLYFFTDKLQTYLKKVIKVENNTLNKIKAKQKHFFF